MATRRDRRARPLPAWLLVALLLAAPVARAETSLPTDHRVSPLQYVVRATFFVGLVVVGVILVRAILNRADDTTPLKKATAKLDRALGLQPRRVTGGATAHDSRTDSGEHPRAPAAGKLQLTLRSPLPPPSR